MDTNKIEERGGPITIAVGVDHRGFELKKFLLSQKSIGIHKVSWLDAGAFSAERTDYPIYTKKVIYYLKNNKADVGILSCGTGIGMAIAANRYSCIYAGLVWNEKAAKLAKEDDNVNVLILPADFINNQEAYDMVNAWLSAEFKKDRYLNRLKMIDQNFLD